MVALNSVPDSMLYRNNTYKPLKGALSIKCLILTAVESVFVINNQTTESVFILPNVHNNSFVTQKSIIICTFILAVHCAFLNGPVVLQSDVRSATMPSYPLRFLPKILELQLLNALTNLQRKICHSTQPSVIIKAVFVTHKIVFTAMHGSVLVNQAYWI